MSEWVEIKGSRDSHRCREWALVCEARGIPHRLLTDEIGTTLAVLEHDVPRAESELEAYDRESASWPPPELEPPPARSDGVIGAMVYVLVLMVFFAFETQAVSSFDWWEAGKTSAARIRDGELWRTITALTLHSGLPHLTGNLVFGVVFGVAVARDLGNGLGWACILASGALGNLLNAFVQPLDHTSIGASTAVFGAIGVLAGFQWRRRTLLRQRPMKRMAPVVVAVVLLGFLGASGERTDVMAHVTGLLSGGTLGAMLGWFSAAADLSSHARRRLGWLALSTVPLAWIVAFVQTS